MAKAENEIPRIDAITPAGTAKYPRLNTPDDKFSPGEPRFDVQFLFDPSEDSQVGKEQGNLIATATAMLDEFYPQVEAKLKAELAEATKSKNGQKIKKAREALEKLNRAEIGTSDVDDEGNDTGLLIIRPKMKQIVKKRDGTTSKRKPVMFDARGKKLDPQPLVGGGSKLKVALTMMPYHMASTGAVGITFYLNAVQILDLVTGGERSASGYGFGAEEGYEAPAEETFGGTAEDESGDGTGF